MSERGSDHLTDERKQDVSCACEQDEGKDASCDLGCGCCGMSGRGGRIRIALLIVLAVVVVVLMVHGFATAG